MKELLSRIINQIRKFVREKLRYENSDAPYYLTIAIAIATFALGLKVFIELADELAENELEAFDTTITNFVISFRTEGLTSFFSFVTDLGDRITYFIIIVALSLLFWFGLRNWIYSIQTIAVLILSAGSNLLLKNYINRERPSLDHLVSVNTLSFPSGHSMSAMAFYGFLIYLALTLNISKRIKLLITIFLSLLIFSIGLSRIYLGVHFPSDVAAGFAGGLIWVALCAIIFNIFYLWRSKMKNSSSFK